jgi:hypothetical protein
MSSYQDDGGPPARYLLEYDVRPMGTVFVKDASGQWQGIEMLIDSGNDITIFTEETARMLGFGNRGQRTMVAGIGSQLTPATMLGGVEIAIGDSTPVRVEAMIMNTSVNLLGRKDVLNHYSMTFEGNRLYVQERCKFCGGV